MPHPRGGGRPPVGRGSALSADDLHGWFEDWLEACNRHDLAAVRGLLDPAVHRSGVERGADAWIRDLDELLAAFPDHRWKRIAVVVDGDRIAAHLRTRGTHRGTWRGIAPTGRHVGSAKFGFFRISGGRVVEFAGGSDPSLKAQLR